MSRAGFLTFLSLVLVLVLGSAPLPAQEAPVGSFADRVARFVSPGVRDADRRLDNLRTQIEDLPDLYDGPRGSRYGFHSEKIASEDEPHWLLIDLEAEWPIDSVVVMPVFRPLSGLQGEGYGFPRRFKIEVSSGREPDNFRMVADHTADDFENPGIYPIKFEGPGIHARFVRMTSTRHVAGEDAFFWAIEELLVLSGNYNVAANRKRDASSHEDLFPNWSLHRVNDGISRLGYPWEDKASPSKGFLSAPSKSASTGKWIVVDLGAPIPIDEIRLVPTTSTDTEVVGGRGFPSNLTIELSTDRDFAKTVFRRGSPRSPLGFPWRSAYTRNCEGTMARYLRITAETLFARGNNHSFALAEIQAYSEGKNVALGKRVFVSDRVDRPKSSGWAPEFAVDGYSSSRRLIELPVFIDRVIERGKLKKERTELLADREEKIEFAATGVTAGVGTLGGVAVFGWIWVIFRQRAVRRRDMETLREQIARDLHDDIGSNLGGIVLLSEAGSTHAQALPEILNDFHEIKETAEHTAESMRDIVWLIHAKKSDLRDLLIKMRKSVESLLGDIKTTIEIEPAEFRNRKVALLTRRHLFFAFKETLTNLRKHAQATSAAIQLRVESKKVTFTVTDDGVGFGPEDLHSAGQGLKNLKRRAERVNGECSIESKPGQGTTVSFSAPLK